MVVESARLFADSGWNGGCGLKSVGISTTFGLLHYIFLKLMSDLDFVMISDRKRGEMLYEYMLM